MSLPFTGTEFLRGTQLTERGPSGTWLNVRGFADESFRMKRTARCVRSGTAPTCRWPGLRSVDESAVVATMIGFTLIVVLIGVLWKWLVAGAVIWLAVHLLRQSIRRHESCCR